MSISRCAENALMVVCSIACINQMTVSSPFEYPMAGEPRMNHAALAPWAKERVILGRVMAKAIMAALKQ